MTEHTPPGFFLIVEDSRVKGLSRGTGYVDHETQTLVPISEELYVDLTRDYRQMLAARVVGTPPNCVVRWGDHYKIADGLSSRLQPTTSNGDIDLPKTVTVDLENPDQNGVPWFIVDSKNPLGCICSNKTVKMLTSYQKQKIYEKIEDNYIICSIDGITHYTLIQYEDY